MINADVITSDDSLETVDDSASALAQGCQLVVETGMRRGKVSTQGRQDGEWDNIYVNNELGVYAK